MLAQNFMTPADLGIRDAEFEALLKVLGMLERDELRHVPEPSIAASTAAALFNMNEWNETFDCGTVRCIGGWAEHIGRLEFDESSNFPLCRLFYPNIPRLAWDKITAAQAAIALRNYLTTGEPNWADAMA